MTDTDTASMTAARVGDAGPAGLFAALPAASTTIVGVSMTPGLTWTRADIEVAAYVRHVTGGRFEEIGGSAYVRIPATRTSQREITRRSGLGAEVTGLAGSAVALAYLNMHLTEPPYIVAVHQAEAFLEVLDRQRDLCPALAAASLVDTALGAQRMHAIPVSVPLSACARNLHGAETPDERAVVAAARQTAALFIRLALDEHPGGAAGGTRAREQAAA